MVTNKKVLVITTLAPPAFGGTPIMVGKLFKHFPKDFYIILADPVTKKTPFIAKPLPCNYYFFDGSSEKGSSITSNKIKLNKNKLVSSNTRLRIQKLDHLTYKFRYFRYIFFDFIQLLLTILFAYREGLRVVKEEKPSHILAISDSGPALLTSYFLSKKTKISFSIFMFDLYKNNKFAPARILTAKILEKNVIESASKIFVAGEGIKKHYDRSYKKKSISIPNSREVPFRTPKVRPARKVMRIVYTGAYYWAQKEAIERFEKVVDNLYWAKFDFYSHDLTDSDRKGVSMIESRKIQREADVLLLPLSFNTGIFSDVIRTAPTGKITEYLVSGTPILVHAPKDAWISQYLRRHKAALVVDDANADSLVSGLQRLRNHRFRKALVEKAFLLAQKNHDLIKNSKLLYNELQEVV